MPAPVHGAADAGPADSRRVRDPLAGIRFRFHLLLCPEDRAPILVLGDRHAALNTDADPLRRGLLTEESLEDGHSFRIRMTGGRGSGFASPVEQNPDSHRRRGLRAYERINAAVRGD